MYVAATYIAYTYIGAVQLKLTGHILVQSKCICLLDFLLNSGQRASHFAVKNGLPHILRSQQSIKSELVPRGDIMVMTTNQTEAGSNMSTTFAKL